MRVVIPFRLLDGSGIIRSTDKGLSWATTMAAVVSNSATPTLLELSGGRLVAIGPQSLVLSSDHGVTWRVLSSRLPFTPAGFTYAHFRKAFFIWHFSCALTASEAAIMRRHVNAGAEILEHTKTLRQIAPLVLASHEWFGGAGYPHRLAGADIPLASRIIAVADAYDAMTQDRAYRIHLESSDAVAEILRCTPAQFDPEIVAAFVAVLGRH